MSVSIGALGHTTAESWNYDETYHWRLCSVCNVVLTETKLLHDAENGKCTTCGYVIGSGEILTGTEPDETVPALPTEAEKVTDTAKPSAEDSQTEEQDGNSLITILLVALVCFAAAITATVIILKKKKGETA